MKSILTTVVVVLALMSSTLYAGFAATGVVSIEFDEVELDEGVAEGNMWLARSSKNDVEIIGCSSKGTDNERWAWCRAQDANGLEVFCVTENPNMLDALQAISPFSYVRFVFENAEFRQDPERGEWFVADCTRLDISTQSLHLPMFTTKKGK